MKKREKIRRGRGITVVFTKGYYGQRMKREKRILHPKEETGRKKESNKQKRKKYIYRTRRKRKEKRK